MDRIAIIGGGHVGITLALDLFMRRLETSVEPHLFLYRRDGHPLMKRGNSDPLFVRDIMSGEEKQCSFPIENIHPLDNSAKSLIQTCQMIVIAVPDIPRLRLEIMDWLVDNILLKEIIIVIVRAGQGGQIGFLARHSNDPRLRETTLILVEDSFYGTRFIGGRVDFKRKRVTNVALRGDACIKAMNQLSQLFVGPSINQSDHNFNIVRPLDLQFDPLGYIIHLGVTLDPRNLELTRRGIQYLHYSDGVHEGNAEALGLIDDERVSLAAAYGASTRPFPIMIEEQYGLPKQATFLSTMNNTATIYLSKSPSNIRELRESRLIQEDVPALLVMSWLARMSGIQCSHTLAHTEQVLHSLACLGIEIRPFYRYLEEVLSLSLRKDSLTQLLTA